MNTDSALKLRVVDFIDGTTVDGPGFRTSIYFAGCEHHCPGCHNPSTWDPASGREMTVDEIMDHIIEVGCDVTFSGGDPMLQASTLLVLARRIHKAGFTVWCYTGYLYEQVMADPAMKALADSVDVLVDGPFLEALRDTSLLFRGSSNQRLIDMRKTKPGEIVLWTSDF